MSVMKLFSTCLMAIGLTAGSIWAFAEPTPSATAGALIPACAASKCATTACKTTAATCVTEQSCPTQTVAIAAVNADACPKADKCCKKKCDGEKCDGEKCDGEKCDASKCATKPVSANACAKDNECGKGKCCGKKDETQPVSADACPTAKCEGKKCATKPVSTDACPKDGKCCKGKCDDKKCEGGKCATQPVSTNTCPKSGECPKAKCATEPVSTDACSKDGKCCKGKCDGKTCDGKKCDAKKCATEPVAADACPKTKCDGKKCNGKSETTPVALIEGEKSCCKAGEKCDSKCCKEGTCKSKCCDKKNTTQPVSADACPTSKCNDKKCNTEAVSADACPKDGKCCKGKCDGKTCDGKKCATEAVSVATCPNAKCEGKKCDEKKCASEPVSADACPKDDKCCKEKCDEKKCDAVQKGTTQPVSTDACAKGGKCCKGKCEGKKCDGKKCGKEGPCEKKEGKKQFVSASKDCPGSKACPTSKLSPAAASAKIRKPVVANPPAVASPQAKQATPPSIRVRIGYSLQDGPVIEVHQPEAPKTTRTAPSAALAAALPPCESPNGCQAARPRDFSPSAMENLPAFADRFFPGFEERFLPPSPPIGPMPPGPAYIGEFSPYHFPPAMAGAPIHAGAGECPFCAAMSAPHNGPFPYPPMMGGMPFMLPVAHGPAPFADVPAMAMMPFPSMIVAPMPLPALPMHAFSMMEGPMPAPPTARQQHPLREDVPMAHGMPHPATPHWHPIQSVSFEGDVPAPGVSRVPMYDGEHAANSNALAPLEGAWVQQTSKTTVRFFCEPSRVRALITIHNGHNFGDVVAELSGTYSVTPDGQMFGVVDHFKLSSTGKESSAIARTIETEMIDQPFALRFRTDGDTLCIKDAKCAGLSWLGDQADDLLRATACGEYTHDSP